jgi:hypothetical protein
MVTKIRAGGVGFIEIRLLIHGKCVLTSYWLDA